MLGSCKEVTLEWTIFIGKTAQHRAKSNEKKAESQIVIRGKNVDLGYVLII